MVITSRLAEGGAHALQLQDDRLIIDPMLVPGPVDGLRLWLIEFGVASRPGSGSRKWIIDDRFHAAFLDAARSWNRRPRRQISQANLDNVLEQQAISGGLAEDWILERERQRLKPHPLLDQVMRTSIEDAGAGYDIASFSDRTVLDHDLFIEVKSYTGRRRFFWTRNEIETARRLGEAYLLCIVNRDRMLDPLYEPEVIRGPYTALIQTENNGWSISPTTFECIALE
ncbi:DUF3883 domain-containing protein [Mesorhizobium sp. M1227]|uniref:DUF3883 domain-containing protein n=1 Tax=Mesorhizobium sp. M1227 TaxID=2957071 RepID=UPI003339D311